MEQPINKVVIWNRADGGVSISYFYASQIAKSGRSEDEHIQSVIRQLEQDPLFVGAERVVGTLADIVPADKTNRDCWSVKNGLVVVDAAKVKVKADRAAEVNAIVEKMGISKEEYEKLNSRKLSIKGDSK